MLATLDCYDLEGVVDSAPRVTAVYISTDCHVGSRSGAVRVRPVLRPNHPHVLRIATDSAMVKMGVAARAVRWR